ncbi:uncharacterized protein N7477_008324 [Penicillium maclennaniae]|uniref:uncharacterized protein n=1 Tax=Penicillium maclennaniae TaxID=1343394 RepID=UPI00254265F7|nr:uncharacterized protein N7477_008324 [Penicillium maclennaniae]KAJ5665876.1 hypothetical protein N7477_008324 [Penicillium maclennaniae]
MIIQASDTLFSQGQSTLLIQYWSSSIHTQVFMPVYPVLLPSRKIQMAQVHLMVPSRNPALPNDIFLTDLGLSQRQQQQYYVALPFDQHTLVAYPSSWALPTTMGYPQGSTASPDTEDRSNIWPTNSQDGSPPVSLEFQNAPKPHSGDLRVHNVPSAQPTSTDNLSSRETPFIIIEDPTHPGTYRERKPRSREDLAKQKQAIHDLKVSGVQLSLLAPIVTAPIGTSAVPQSLPSHETIAALNQLGATVFQRAEAFTAIWSIREPQAEILHTRPLTSFWRKQSFVCSVPNFRGSKLPTGSHPLVQEALKLARLFLAISGIAKTSFSTQSDDLGVARLTMLLVLVAGSQRLVEISQFFSVGLHDALRRKDLQDNYCDGQYRPQINDPLHPLWVAYALYYRVISGLLDLEPDSPIANIFQSLETHLDEAHKTTWSVIVNLSPCARHLKRRPKQALREDIPILSSASHFDLTVSTNIEAWDDEFGHQMMLSRDDPFSEASHGVRALFEDSWTQPSFTNIALTSQPGLKSSTEPRVARSMFGSISRIGSPDSSSIDPAVLNLLDLTAVPQGELRETIDTVMVENPSFVR